MVTMRPAEIEALVSSFIAMMQAGSINELEVAFGGVSIRLHAGSPEAASLVAMSAVPIAETGLAPPVEEYLITAPMIGTYYAAPSPGAPPFVEVGDLVEVSQVVGIIEAMKIMNEISADRAGTVRAMIAANAQPVEYGSPLIRLQLTGSDGT